MIAILLLDIQTNRADNPRTFSSFRYISESKQSKNELSQASDIYLRADYPMTFWAKFGQKVLGLSALRYISETRESPWIVYSQIYIWNLRKSLDCLLSDIYLKLKNFLKFQIYIWEQTIQELSQVSDIYLRADNPRTFSSFRYISESKQSKDFLKFQIYIWEQTIQGLSQVSDIYLRADNPRTFSSFR
jgi:hypothetical protein